MRFATSYSKRSSAGPTMEIAWECFMRCKCTHIKGQTNAKFVKLLDFMLQYSNTNTKQKMEPLNELLVFRMQLVKNIRANLVTVA